MNEFQRMDLESKPYDVSVGLVRVRVEARSAEEAVTAARRAFCREMPRMWDVICNLSARRFDVRPVAKAA